MSRLQALSADQAELFVGLLKDARSAVGIGSPAGQDTDARVLATLEGWLEMRAEQARVDELFDCCVRDRRTADYLFEGAFDDDYPPAVLQRVKYRLARRAS